MSRVFKRGEIWWIDFSVGGHRVRRSAGSTRKKDAEEIMARMMEEVRQRKFLGKKPDRSLSYLLNRYYNEVSTEKKRVKEDFYNIKILLKYLDDIMLSEVTPAKLNQFKKTRQDEGLSAAAVNRPLALLSHAFNTAIKEWEICNENPVSKVKRLSEKRRLRYLSREEATALINQCQGHLKPIVEWALTTGMRFSEITALNWSDIDHVNKFIHVRDTKDTKPGRFVKSRAIPLNKKHDTILAQTTRHISGTVFHYQGKQIKSVKTTFNKAVKRAELKDVTFHILRHTFASWAVMDGMPLHVLKEILGHSSLDMVMRYAHLSPEHLRKEMEIVSRW